MENTKNEKQCAIHDVSNSAVRPPLGLVPKWVRQKERYYEVCGAIARYYDAGKKIPIEWVEEYNELVEHCCQRLRLGEVGEFNPRKPIRITNV